MHVNSRPAVTLRCPYCHDADVAADAPRCETCGAQSHLGCWREHGACPSCQRPAGGVDPPGGEEDDSERWFEVAVHRRRQARRWGWSVVAGGLFVLAALSGWLAVLSMGPYPSGWTFILVAVAYFGVILGLLALVPAINAWCQPGPNR